MTVAIASTVDGGKTWQPVPLPPDLDPAFVYEIASQIRGGIYFVTATDGWLFYRGLYSTRDGGLTWTEEPTDGVITQMGKAADGTVWAIEKHYDDWSVKEVVVAPYRQWRELIPNVITRMDGMSLTLADAKHAWISRMGRNYKAELIATEDGGATWYSLNSPCVHGDAGVVAVGPRTLWYACGGSGAGPWGDKMIITSSDGGLTWTVKGWTPMGPPYNGATLSAFGFFIGFGAVSPSFAYMSLGDSGPLITRDGGATWEYLRLGCAPGEFHQAFFADTAHGWAFYQTCINRTVDGGKTWECTELPENKPCVD